MRSTYGGVTVRDEPKDKNCGAEEREKEHVVSTVRVIDDARLDYSYKLCLVSGLYICKVLDALCDIIDRDRVYLPDGRDGRCDPIRATHVRNLMRKLVLLLRS